ncbi:ribosomal protein L4/L1e [Chloroherpeton thalassium ATCC 35110]|uniref:Large ribosomal subunit protein uL4 n=1 Tax=Chloroherpeton thalassium (strain ATCC 35110 / GB-78) TaxID=517418 RepID=RL4_CHLT3|nr:50S ribosomal protein L4 [Chloroherpeton thalassium]B3QY25.1 RecName: Full=Large ribosomal subunit protein uL4; AltName: Full=50S ribosomal protein L4 [Chloroherpeton thalassium ATCC 35110]ACF13553.1 ribosomal protein L4/L1e [Chloroherpeton thalassium ATCC 35110]
MEVKVLNKDGAETGETVELKPVIFEIEPNDHAIYLDVRSIMANQHQGTHKVKTRSEVSGGGRKPYRQKGTGNARRGSSRSPVMIGGGAIFGPKPHDYVVGINKKMKRLARISALSYKAKNNEIIVMEDYVPSEIKTKEVVSFLKSLGLNEKKTLLLMPSKNDVMYKSGRNISKLSILEANKASTYDLLNNKTLLIQKSALETLERSLGVA